MSINRGFYYVIVYLAVPLLSGLVGKNKATDIGTISQ